MYAFIEENDPRGYNINSWVIHTSGTEANAWGDPLTVWHGGKSSFGFLDGHAEIRKWSKETEELFNKANETGAWGSWGSSPDPGSDMFEDLRWLLEGWPQ